MCPGGNSAAPTESDRRIARLHEVATELQALTDEESVYEATIDAAVEILGIEWCCIAVPREGYFELAYVSPDGPGEEGDRYLRVGEGVTGETFETGETILMDSRHDHPASKPAKSDLESLLSVPIDDRGVFQGTSTQKEAFDRADREVAELLIAHTSAALDRIERERELKRQNERLDRFASVVSHDMRNPLTVAAGNVEIALETGEKDRLERALDAIGRAERIIDDVLAVARGGKEPDTEPCDLREFSRRSWEAVGDDGTTFEASESVDVVADPDGLMRLLENLLRNAVEHGGEHVRVRALEAGFAVEDDGPGFPDSARDSFEPGTTGEGGTGLGLAICREVADAHGWTLSVDDGDWTRVVVGDVTFD